MIESWGAFEAPHGGALHLAAEGGGMGWMDEMTLLDYASWRNRDHIMAALVRGGADPHPVPTGACRAALEALPQEGLVWLLRAVIGMVRHTHCHE